jgi:hypothetical protein
MGNDTTLRPITSQEKVTVSARANSGSRYVSLPRTTKVHNRISNNKPPAGPAVHKHAEIQPSSLDNSTASTLKTPSHRSTVSTSSAAGGTRSSSWSTRDDEILIQARAQGLNWNQIGPKHFPSKTPNACRKRHERLIERQNAEQWDGVKVDVLAQAYVKVRREMWSMLAARVGEKWQLVETKVRMYFDNIRTDAKHGVVSREGSEEPCASLSKCPKEADRY